MAGDTQAFPFGGPFPVEHPGPLPDRADVVIIGGGIAGVMTAWHLADQGKRAVVVEKGRVGAEQSGRNWGWIRKQGRDPGEIPLMIASERQWLEIAPQLDVDIGLRRGGVVYLARRPERMGDFENWLGIATEFGLDTRVITSAEVASMMPQAARRWEGGLYTPSDLRAEPALATPALARHAVSKGAVIVEDCAARALYREAGRVAGLVTEKGLIRAPEVVVAGGAWSALFLRREGISIPQLSVRASVVATGPLPEIFAGCASDGELGWRRRADGGYTLGPSSGHGFWVGPDAFRALRLYVPQLRRDFRSTRLQPWAPRHYPDAWTTRRRWRKDQATAMEGLRILDPAPEDRLVRDLGEKLRARFPGLGPVPIVRRWAGMIDTMPDTVPVIDRVESVPGLTIATGLSGHGFGIGPEVGRVAAALATGNEPDQILTRFRLSRFTDGSAMDLGPVI